MRSAALSGSCNEICLGPKRKGASLRVSNVGVCARQVKS